MSILNEVVTTNKVVVFTNAKEREDVLKATDAKTIYRSYRIVGDWYIHIPNHLDTLDDEEVSYSLYAQTHHYDGKPCVDKGTFTLPEGILEVMPEISLIRDNPILMVIPLLYYIIGETNRECAINELINDVGTFRITLAPVDTVLFCVMPKCCACGLPNEAFETLRQTMNTFGRATTRKETDPDTVYGDGGKVFIAYYLDTLGHLIVHGSSIGTSRLTAQGHALTVILATLDMIGVD